MARTKFGKIRVDELINLGTLANGSVEAGDIIDAVERDYYAISSDLNWSLREHAGDQGPIVVGICHGDYSDAEIKEALEASENWMSGDMVAGEQSRRKVREIGAFPSSDAGVDLVLNDGKPIRSKVKIYVVQGKTLKAWAWNRSGGALTTGSGLSVSGNVWVRAY